jgi:hypothetical protein
MLLTKELLDAVSACYAGQKSAEDYNCIDRDLEDVIRIAEQNNLLEYANWARGLYSNRIALKVSKYYEYIQYLILDPIANVYKSTPNESDVATIKQQIIESYPDMDQNLILVYEEIKSLDGIVHRFLI